jgi:hypothetical protein
VFASSRFRRDREQCACASVQGLPPAHTASAATLEPQRSSDASRDATHVARRISPRHGLEHGRVQVVLDRSARLSVAQDTVGRTAKIPPIMAQAGIGTTKNSKKVEFGNKAP